MAIALVAHAKAGSSDNVNVTTTGIDTTGATLLVASVAEYDPGSTTFGTVTDSKSNTWTPLTTYLAGSTETQVKIWYSVPTSVGTSHTFTSTGNGPFPFPAITVAAFSGVHATPFDQESGAEAAASTLQPGSLTPSQDNCLAISACARVTGGISSISGTGWSIIDNQTTPTQGALAYQIQTTAAATNPTWNLSGSADASAAMAIFKAAAVPTTFTVIGHTGKGSTGGSSVTSDTLDTTGADLIVVAVSEYDAGITTGQAYSSVTDNKSNTWNARTLYTADNDETQIRIWYTTTPAITGSGHTFTASGAGGSPFPVILVLAVASSLSGDPFDQENGAESATSALQPGSVTPSQDNELVVTAVSRTTGTITSIDSGFTVTDNISTYVGGNIYGAMAYKIQTSAAAVNPTWTLQFSADASAAIATFKSANAGAASSRILSKLMLLGIGNG